MRDPMTFEDRLTDAFAAYTAAAPLGVDPHALVAGLAGSGRTRRLALPTFNLARFGGVRLALVLGLLALASVAGLLFAGGLLRSDPAPLGGGGRSLVWLPSGVNAGTAHLLGADGVERASRAMESRGCPTLLGSADAMAVPGFGSLSFRGFVPGEAGQVSTADSGGERWSPDHRALALVDMETGPVSVVTFPDGDFVNPRSTRYAIKGALEGSFSPDGSRLAVPVRSDASTIAIHLLQGGTDTMLATVQTLDVTQGGSASRIVWAADGSALMVATTGTDGEGLARVGLDGGVTQVLANRHLRCRNVAQANGLEWRDLRHRSHGWGRGRAARRHAPLRA